jgi:hypothetical protein
MTQYERPDWEPLRGIAGDELLGYFMWMHEVALRDRTAIHAYKHITTRHYVHLTRDARAFVYLGDERYRQVDPSRLFWGIAMAVGDLATVDDFETPAMWSAVEHCERLEARARGETRPRRSSPDRLGPRHRCLGTAKA